MSTFIKFSLKLETHMFNQNPDLACDTELRYVGKTLQRKRSEIW